MLVLLELVFHGRETFKSLLVQPKKGRVLSRQKNPPMSFFASSSSSTAPPSVVDEFSLGHLSPDEPTTLVPFPVSYFEDHPFPEVPEKTEHEWDRSRTFGVSHVDQDLILMGTLALIFFLFALPQIFLRIFKSSWIARFLSPYQKWIFLFTLIGNTLLLLHVLSGLQNFTLTGILTGLVGILELTLGIAESTLTNALSVGYCVVTHTDDVTLD